MINILQVILEVLLIRTIDNEYFFAILSDKIITATFTQRIVSNEVI